jgi:hypothetical protein
MSIGRRLGISVKSFAELGHRHLTILYKTKDD